MPAIHFNPVHTLSLFDYYIIWTVCFGVLNICREHEKRPSTCKISHTQTCKHTFRTFSNNAFRLNPYGSNYNRYMPENLQKKIDRYWNNNNMTKKKTQVTTLMHFQFHSFYIRFFFSLSFFSHSLLEMEFENYESELADYSLQDSPFYEANTPIIFGLTTNSTSVFASNRTTYMVDAMNLSAKKSSIMMSTKCQSLKSAFERTTNGTAIGKSIDSHSNINDASNSPSKKRCDTNDRFFTDKNIDLHRNGTESSLQPKKKRKCVSFLPNYVQVTVYVVLVTLKLNSNFF